MCSLAMHNVGPLIRPFIRVSVSKTLPNGMGMARVPVRRNLQHWGTVTLRNEDIPILHLLLLLPLRRLHRFTFRKLLRWTDHPAVPCAAPRSQPVVLRGFQATILIAETTNLVPRGDRESAAGMTTMRRQKIIGLICFPLCCLPLLTQQELAPNPASDTPTTAIKSVAGTHGYSSSKASVGYLPTTLDGTTPATQKESNASGQYRR